MYVTWRRQTLTHTWHGDKRFQRRHIGVSLSESRRVDGKPRRRLVAHLGHVEEARIDRTPDQAAFWYRTDLALDQAEITEEQREAFRQQIAERIPRPDLTLLADADEWSDLMVQDSGAAAALLDHIPLDDDMRNRRRQTVGQLRDYQDSRARMDSWWERLRNRNDRKHRQEFAEKAERGEVEELKRFDYSQLSPDVAEAVQGSTERIKELQ